MIRTSRSSSARQSAAPPQHPTAARPLPPADAPGVLAELAVVLTHVWRKLWLLALGVLHLLFSSDRAWLARTSPPLSAAAAAICDWPLSSSSAPAHSKRIVFVRHAESEWNVVFNRGFGWRAIVRFVRACVREWLMFPTPDSLFIDSPLSRTGVCQARALFHDAALAGGGHLLENGGSKNAEKAAVLQFLSAPLPNSIVVASNLRRAIDTARVASAARLETPGETINVLSVLQEIGRNIDTLAISDAYALKAQVLSATATAHGVERALFNLSESHGNKPVLGCGRTRLQAFARWVMQQKADVVVVYGHSLWFRAFCQEYFPAAVPHDAKRLKLANCGVVSFTLEEFTAPATATVSKDVFVERAPRHRIDPASFLSVR